MPPPVAVIGAGLLGLTSALLLAEDGHRVEVFDRHPRPWSGVSAINEGKVHLGPVYALGDERTAAVMLRGALAFAATIERALARSVDWDALAGDPFEYLVMPDGLVGPERLAAHYRRLDALLGDLGPAGVRPRYLGRPLTSVIDPVPRVDPATGLPAFRSHERAVDVVLLGALLVDAARAHPGIRMRQGARVTGVDATSGRLVADASGDGGRHGPFAAIVNCAWEGRSRIARAAGAPDGPVQNVRVKSMVRLRPVDGARTVTLVQGPFGDVVAHHTHTYASWYPVGRIHQETARHVSPTALRAAVEAGASRELAEGQVAALQRLGLLSSSEEIVASGAGVILGDGEHDIDDAGSGLHRRARFGVDAHRRLLTPRNYKLTTAPLAARVVSDHVRELVHG
ncbi:MAG: FAD-dependent oxidoreductase [Miltoncostaeaceae bacterium]